jgi:hypothetical protein
MGKLLVGSYWMSFMFFMPFILCWKIYLGHVRLPKTFKLYYELGIYPGLSGWAIRDGVFW